MNSFLASVGYPHWILNVLILLPLAGIVPVALLPAVRARYVALGVSLAELVLSLGLWWAFDPSTAAMQFTVKTPWLPVWGMAWNLGLDGIALVMVLLTTAITPLTILASFRYIAKRETLYYSLMLAMLSGMLGVFLALDMFLFYVFWELMLIPMYFLIGIWGGANRLYAAIKFFIYTMAGSLLMLVAIVVMYFQAYRLTGQPSFAYEAFLKAAPSMGDLAPWLFAAFALAFAIKVPVFPFHTWLPDAHVEAPTAGSVILASILLKMGTYGFLRFAVPFFPGVALSPAVTSLVVGCAVIGVIYGALVAMVQPDVKKLVAYSSVSHLGFVMLGLWAATLQSVQGALMIMIGHGISTGALFLLIGMLYERRHTREIAAFGGLARVMPLFSLALVVTSLASIGLPGLNGFVGEFLVLVGSFARYPWATGIAATGVIFAAAYLLWALQRILFNRLDRPENAHLPDLSARELCVILPFLAGMVWLGLYPRPVLDRTHSAAVRYIELTQPSAAPAGAPPGTSSRPVEQPEQ